MLPYQATIFKNPETTSQTCQVPFGETIRERQLKFTVHSIRMPTDEPANRFVINESRINHIFGKEHQGRDISIKFRCTFYNMARNLSKQER